MEKELILEKLSYLKENLDDLKDRYDRYVEVEDSFDKKTLKLALAKLTEEVIETAVTINTTILISQDKRTSTYFESFKKIGEVFNLDKGLFIQLAKTTSLRNKVVHEYEKVDDQARLENEIPHLIEKYDSYIRVIRELVKND